MPDLFEPLRLRSVTLRNRIAVSPMCTYSAPESRPTSWHLVHLGARASGGAGLVLTEATAVEPRGRISPLDCGLWDDAQIEAWTPIASFLRDQGAVAGMQLAHAGRKAGTRPPFLGRGPLPPEEGWEPVAPSTIPFDEGYRMPRALTRPEMDALAEAWGDAARRAHQAGFQLLEIHMAHGYLLHEFLSPLANQRTDEFGGLPANRMRYPMELVHRVRANWPDDLPLIVRISATDWIPGGWDIEQSVVLCRALRAAGVDLIDCSSGGLSPRQQVPLGPGYQVPFAERIRREAGIATGTVGLITEPAMAQEILGDGRADLILLGREFLREPYWPLRAAAELGLPAPWPTPYGWAVG